MTKKIDCSKVKPADGCGHVVRGKDEKEVLQRAAEHAASHGMSPTPEMLEQIKRFIEEEDK